MNPNITLRQKGKIPQNKIARFIVSLTNLKIAEKDIWQKIPIDEGEKGLMNV
jgi:hypothetical protein